MEVVEKYCGRDMVSEILQFMTTRDLLVYHYKGQYRYITNKITRNRLIQKIQTTYPHLNSEDVEELFSILKIEKAKISGPYLLQFIFEDEWNRDIDIIGPPLSKDFGEYLNNTFTPFHFTYTEYYGIYYYRMGLFINTFDGNEFQIENENIKGKIMYIKLSDMCDNINLVNIWYRASCVSNEYKEIEYLYNKRGFTVKRYGEYYPKEILWRTVIGIATACRPILKLIGIHDRHDLSRAIICILTILTILNDLNVLPVPKFPWHESVRSQTDYLDYLDQIYLFRGARILVCVMSFTYLYFLHKYNVPNYYKFYYGYLSTRVILPLINGPAYLLSSWMINNLGKTNAGLIGGVISGIVGGAVGILITKLW